MPAQRIPGERTIVEALLQYGREHVNERIGETPEFTPHAEANRLVIEDPFAFLLAVVFDQGIPAERAWRAPYELKFPGIGQRRRPWRWRSSPATLGVPITDMCGSDIAFDVHVRRVSLRTQLAGHDDLDHIVDVARRLHPERPGELDFLAWLVGRRWCGAGVPNCAACVLRDVCPRDIDRASAVRGS